MLYGELVRQSNMMAFNDVFWILGVICLAMVPLMSLWNKSLTGCVV